jgi:EAL domain-containing protein (putative c-di-GMP-specific phosphodiesterase class I)
MKSRPSGCDACRKPAAMFPFTMAFQPIVDLLDHRIDSYEALVRGPDNEPAGEMFAQVNDQNRYAFDQACRVKAIELASRLGLTARLNINFLPNAVYDPKACIRTTLETAARTGFRRDHLTFEFTEGERITDYQHILNIIAEYRRHGFKIALDDFGTSYSGLSRMAELRPDIIKLDRDFVKTLDTDKMRQAIMAAVVRLGEDVGIKVVAEGFERRAEIDAARAVGVRYMQGFYFGAPLFQAIAGESDIVWPDRPAKAASEKCVGTPTMLPRKTKA